MLPVIPVIISILISIGYITTPEEYYEMDAQEQLDAHIIVDDLYEL